MHPASSKLVIADTAGQAFWFCASGSVLIRRRAHTLHAIPAMEAVAFLLA